MMLGEKELIKLFPDFADLVQPSGIDLELDDIFSEDAVYIENTGATYNGLEQIKKWFEHSRRRSHSVGCEENL